MKYFYILACTIFLLLLLLPVKFRIRFRFIETKIYLRISSSYLFGFFSPEVYPFDKKYKRKEPNFNGFIASKNIIKELEYIELAKYTWDRLDIERLEIKIGIGSIDPFVTSILYGLLWAIKGISVSYLLMYKEIDILDTDIIPLFEENHLDIRFDCIIKIKMVYIINIWIKLIKLYKGGERNVRTPNRRTNEIYNE